MEISAYLGSKVTAFLLWKSKRGGGGGKKESFKLLG